MAIITEGSKIRLKNGAQSWIGEVVRLFSDQSGRKADVAIESDGKRLLETYPVETLEAVDTIFDRLEKGLFTTPRRFFLRQLAIQFPIENLGGELSNSKTDLLPHQILLTHQVMKAQRRHFLIADEVGLGKTIETGMIIRELHARKEGRRILVICPAGLTANWQNELHGCFRLYFEILGKDFTDSAPDAWERHNLSIASIDTLKKEERLDKLVNAPKWDAVIFDEAHHLTRKKYGKKVERTQNYRLAERLRGNTRDLLLLSATPHQGDPYQFWSIIQLLDDQLFEDPEAMKDHRGLLGRVMFRRTKREVTDAEGKPIFMRRQVHSQKFQLSLREEQYNTQIVEYLRVGYNMAESDEGKANKRQRAVGFLMATFQKIMSSSPRAIKQSLRRRLLTVYARKQMELESGRKGAITRSDISSQIMRLQERMRTLIRQVVSYEEGEIDFSQADARISQFKQRLAKRPAFQEELTQWALDAEEGGESALEIDIEIPNESEKLEELIEMIDDGPDRKFDTLIRAIETLRAEVPTEKFILFTQYRETVNYLKDELSHYYDKSKIAMVVGGSLDDKIAACESFWKADGAQFLLCTTAGGEGINLQVARILFNYDLPWNPMAVEQRIGRIHRYGQTETAQVYNLVGENTIEEKVYDILESKLREIAETIGKIDEVTGQVTEDFRSEVLGYLGSNTNYSELYKDALLKRDYERTSLEIADAMNRANEASRALRELTQELSAFNLEKYAQLKGRYTLQDLRGFTEAAILELGGAFIPSGEIVEITVPEILRKYSGVLGRYPNATFDRKLATRKKGLELMGLGHPLLDAIVQYFRKESSQDDVTAIGGDLPSGSIQFRFVATVKFIDGAQRFFYYCYDIGKSKQSNNDLAYLSDKQKPSVPAITVDWLSKLPIFMKEKEAVLRSEHEGVADVRFSCVGIMQRRED